MIEVIHFLASIGTPGQHPEVWKAARVAATAHKGVERKYEGGPYIVHPFRVATLLRSQHLPPEMWAVGLLHDTVEDTFITHEYIAGVFGPRIAEGVAFMTHADYPESMNRAAKKAAERKRMMEAAPDDSDLQSVKVADLIDNFTSVVDHDPRFAKVFMGEFEELLDGPLAKANEHLVTYARRQIARAKRSLAVDPS